MMLAFLDMPSGISGDMFLGCLVDAGWPVEKLHEAIRALNWPDDFDHGAWSVEKQDVMRGPLRATAVQVSVTEEQQPHRRLEDVRRLLDGSQLPPIVVENALAIFTRLAEAEAAVHGMEVQTVHFHEVGALDSIIDVVGVCAGVHALGLSELHAGPFPAGGGYVRSQHGLLPLPAPATLELLSNANAPVTSAPGPGELVTPTGAAITLHFAGDRWGHPRMRLRQVALGAGQKAFDWPNVARLWIGEPYNETGSGSGYSAASLSWTMEHPDEAGHDVLMSLLETNIDDMNPEFYSAVAEKLFANGARDVWYRSIHMKKNRPGVMLSVLTTLEDEAAVAELLLKETTTLGMRVHRVGRYEAQRSMAEVQTPFGPIPVKLKQIKDAVVGAVPEFEACRHAANQHGRSVREVYEVAAAVAWQRFLAPEEPDS